ncbi:MAG: PAS domain S-box protein, partial [Chitinivibrionales bacterium]
LSDIPFLLYDIGYAVTREQFSSFQLFYMKITPLPAIVQKINSLFEKSIHKGLIAQACIIGPGRGQISFTPKKHASYSTQICDFNRGCVHGVISLKGYRNIEVKELQCAARDSNPSCIIEFSWTPQPTLIESLKNFFLFRVRNHHAIVRHMEENHGRLQQQYAEILSMRDFYSHMMENLKESIVWLNAEGIIEFSNNSFSVLTGVSPSDSAGEAFADFAADQPDAELFHEAIAECREKRSSTTVEISLRRTDGERRVGEATIKWVIAQHRPGGFILSIRDITESKQMQQRLQLAEDKYRSLYENSPALIVGIDLRGFIIYANPAMVEQSEYSEQELRSMHFGSLVAPDVSVDTDRIFDTILHQPSRLQEVHFRTKRGQWKTIAFNSYQIFDDNGLGGIAGIGVDITETKRLNEQLIKTQRMELLGQMAGGLAHDFRNIMTAITGYAQIIKTQSSEGKTHEHADVILGAACRAGDLVNKLLSFSRGDKVEMKEFDLCEVVREAGALIRGSSPSCIKVETKTPDKKIEIIGDATKIHQCLLNLGINARDAIGTFSPGTITVVLELPLDDENNVRIMVEDTGEGISPDMVERIFDPFFSTKVKKEGTGLGLSVVYGIVKAHGGTITVASHPGEGTTFEIVLPVNVARKTMKPVDKKIAVFAEDRVFRGFCLDILTSYGLGACSFNDMGRICAWLEKQQGKSICIVADVSLPDISQAGFVNSVRKIHHGVSIVWVGSEQKTVTDGNTRYLPKPFSPADLIRTVRAVVSDA